MKSLLIVSAFLCFMAACNKQCAEPDKFTGTYLKNLGELGFAFHNNALVYDSIGFFFTIDTSRTFLRQTDIDFNKESLLLIGFGGNCGGFHLDVNIQLDTLNKLVQVNSHKNNCNSKDDCLRVKNYGFTIPKIDSSYLLLF